MRGSGSGSGGGGTGGGKIECVEPFSSLRQVSVSMLCFIGFCVLRRGDSF